MSPGSKKKAPKMERDSYVVPKNKKQLLEYINEAGIEDIICTSSIIDGRIVFGFEIRTKDDKSFNFGQDLILRPYFDHVEVLDMSTGDCHEVDVNLGKEFDNTKYKHMHPATWTLKKCE